MERKTLSILVGLVAGGLAIAGLAAAQFVGGEESGVWGENGAFGGLSAAVGVEERELGDLGGGTVVVEETVGENRLLVEETTLGFTGEGTLVRQCVRDFGQQDEDFEESLGAYGVGTGILADPRIESTFADQTILGLSGEDCVLVEERFAEGEEDLDENGLTGDGVAPERDIRGVESGEELGPGEFERGDEEPPASEVIAP